MTPNDLAELAGTAACSLDAGAAAERAADFRALLAPRVRTLTREGSRAGFAWRCGPTRRSRTRSTRSSP